MAIQKFQTSLVKTVDGTQYVGENNRLFFDLPTRTFRLSDEVTPGGIVIGTGGGGSNTEFTEKFTLKSDETTDPVQTQFYIYYGTTTDASTTRLYKDSSNTSIEVPQQTTMFFEVDIIGRNDTTPDYGAFKVKGVIDKNNNGDTSIIMNQKEIMHDTICSMYFVDKVSISSRRPQSFQGDNVLSMHVWCLLALSLKVMHTFCCANA